MRTLTLSGSLKFAGKDRLAEGLISLLMAIKGSQVKLTDLKAFDGNNILITSGVITFEVTGTDAELEKFRAIYTS